ncbi:SGNH/GDSL hydrolase family protein [Candidatus Saccharibacteria bacterium]|nr:SGNH/GDSL hydrolase family protein [Candidatus Saccharibacteria bacterium]
MMKRYLIFGDSLAYGAWDSEGGWADRLKRYLHQKSIDTETDRSQLFNLGIGGDNSRDILTRIETEIQPRLADFWTPVILISCGLNDTRIENGDIVVKIEEFQHNLTKIFEIANKYSDEVYYVEMPPIPGVVRFKNFEFSDERTEKYMEIAKEISEQLGVKFIAVRDKYSTKDIEEGFSRVLGHPTNRSHEIIYQTVKKELNT